MEARAGRLAAGSQGEEEVPKAAVAVRVGGVVAFEKNYPKNIFIPLIEHLGEVGLQREYEACVGTRSSFEGKNVVSLAEIHCVMSQPWFAATINLPALRSNIANKILMNSKIKKKLFHLLLLARLFQLPLHDARHFKKHLSRHASQVAAATLPDHPLFHFPSALIYLLSLFANGLASSPQSPSSSPPPSQRPELPSEEDSKNTERRQREVSSKEEYKHYIGRIVSFLNGYHGDAGELLDLMEAVKATIGEREAEVREMYGLGEQVPAWEHFSSIVVNGCYLHKRARGKLTFSMLNQWVQQFRERATSLAGFLALRDAHRQDEDGGQDGDGGQDAPFRPIVLISPPQPR